MPNGRAGTSTRSNRDLATGPKSGVLALAHRVTGSTRLKMTEAELLKKGAIGLLPGAGVEELAGNRQRPENVTLLALMAGEAHQNIG